MFDAYFLNVKKNQQSYIYDNFFRKKLDDNKTSYPTQRIIETIHQKANEIYQRNGGKRVNIWVTGHSLGAALAQVFYAR